jgi:hypothetical protein
MGPARGAKEPAVGLELDGEALRLLKERGPGQAISIVVVHSLGSPVEGLSVEWGRAAQAEQDSRLVRMATSQGVPVYVHQRLAAYLRWHAVGLKAWKWGPWRGLRLEREAEVWREVSVWERRHPGLSAPRLQASAG